MLLRSLVLTLMLAGLVMGATLAAEPEQQGSLLQVVATEAEYSEKPPEQALMAFLTWYVEGRMRSDHEEGFPDPLMSYAYLDREDLTDNFKRYISAEMPRPGADPVLDTQWIKPVMRTGTVVITGDSARVSVYTYRFPNQSYQQTPLLYFLVRQDGNWLIDRVEREEPRKVVEGFYKWYKKILSEGQNPLVSGAYRQSGFLTKDFIVRLDDHVASLNRGGSQKQIDPILFGYELYEPQSAYCEIKEHSATIFISLSGRPHNKGDRLLVTLSRVDERWKIDAITPE